MRPSSLWEGERLTLDHAIELTIESLRLYGPLFRHWVIAYSGGKDSTTVVVLVASLIASGLIQAPERLTVLYADTRMELPPLQSAAMQLLEVLRTRGIQTHVVMPALDDRFMVYMLGRGVPPPKNRFRWCTPKLKIEPMEEKLHEIRGQSGEKFLLLTGVRVGESAARDQRIALSCSKDGAECGQGWYQVKTPEAVADILAPCLHWRVCHVWDWLTFHAPHEGFPTQVIAEVYGGEEKEDINARTGCVGCNLASKDVALETVLRLPCWQYLAPLKRLRPLYGELLQSHHRLRKDGTDRRKDGRLAAHPMRMGPLTLEARAYGLAQVLDIQEQVNRVARQQDTPCIDLINAQEHARILELIAEKTWPQKWTGEEVRADVLLPQVVADGIIQSLLIG